MTESANFTDEQARRIEVLTETGQMTHLQAVERVVGISKPEGSAPNSRPQRLRRRLGSRALMFNDIARARQEHGDLVEDDMPETAVSAADYVQSKVLEYGSLEDAIKAEPGLAYVAGSLHKPTAKEEV